MTVAYQPSLLDLSPWPEPMAAAPELGTGSSVPAPAASSGSAGRADKVGAGCATAGPRLAPLAGSVRRQELTEGAWVDSRPGWLRGADELFEQLAHAVPWREERRQMYDRTVAVPRLLSFFGVDEQLPHPLLYKAKQALDEHYADELGEVFETAGLCFYRDGRDSVAWHGDTIGRGKSVDTMVAILSVGDPRNLLLRPRGGSTALRLSLGHGDLIVMGGSCQRTWEHAVPKTSRPVGPRISIQFRPRGVQ